MELQTKLDNLSSVQLFEDLSYEELVQLSEMMEVTKFSKHKTIYKRNDEADCVYVLIEGVIKITSRSQEGREVIKTLIHPKALFGIGCLSGGDKRSNTAKVMDTEVICYRIMAEDFKSYLQSNWKLTEKFIEYLGKRLKYTEERFESLVFKDARERIVDFLKENANSFGRQVGLEMLIKHNLTQQDIANYTGTSRQTVTYVLNDLKRQNQIYFKRKSILIRDIATLC